MSDLFGIERKPILIQEEDGSPLERYKILKFPNTTLTDNNDGSVSFSLSGSGSTPGTDLIGIKTIGSATIDTLTESLKIYNSAGLTSGGTITDGGSETVDVAALTGAVRSTDAHDGELFHFDLSATTGLSIPTDTVRYVGVEYNAGSPQVIVKSSDSWNTHTEFSLGSVVNESGTLYILNNPEYIVNFGMHTLHRFYETDPFKRADRLGGLIIGETGTRYVTVTTGELYDRVTEFLIPAIDTSGSDTFDSYSSAGLESSGNSQWDNDNYDNAGVLTTLTTGRYANLWWYLQADGSLLCVYGTDQYAIASQAEEETSPTVLPNRITVQGRLIGRFIFQKGASATTEIQSAFTTAFAVGVVSNHANLSNLNWAAAGHTMDTTLDMNANNIIDVSNLSVGDSTLPGRGNLRLYGTASNINTGAHMEFVTSTDVHPVRFLLNSTHDSLSDGWDLYYNGTNWLRGSTNSGFVYQKSSSTFTLLYDSGGAKGSISSLNIGWSLDDSGNMYTLGTFGIGEPLPATKLEITDTAPYLTLHNSTHEDTDGGRESRIIAKGEQSGGEETTLGYDEWSHKGTSDDQLGQKIIYINDGNDGDTPSKKMQIYNQAINTYIPSDSTYPTFQQLDFAHDNIALTYDGRFDGSNWISSDAGSNYSLYKTSDFFRIYYDSNVAAGNIITWNTGFQMTTSGEITKPAQPSFYAQRSGDQSNVIGGSVYYTIPYNSEVYDIGNNFNASTGVFSAPVTGKYILTFAVETDGIGNTNTDMIIILQTSNRQYRTHRSNAWGNKSVGLEFCINSSVFADMDAGDTAYVRVYAIGNKVIELLGGIETWYSGGLMH